MTPQQIKTATTWLAARFTAEGHAVADAKHSPLPLCPWCGGRFHPRKRWQRFCRPSCRKAAHKVRKERETRDE